jgi:hypothetical protein
MASSAGISRKRPGGKQFSAIVAGRWPMLGLMLASASCVPVWESEAPLSFDEPSAEAQAAGLAARPANSASLLVSLFANGRPSAFHGRTALDRMRSLDCLAEAIYYEAASESENGQRAVAQVVLNRVRHPAWPNSVCGVVYQGPMRPGGGCQFTFTCDGSLRVRPAGLAWARARVLAAEALAGSVFTPVGLSTHYHTHAVSPAWAPALRKTIVIGAHIFYGLPGTVGETAAFNAAYSGREPLPHPSMTLIRRTDIAAVIPPGLTLPRTVAEPVAPTAGQPDIAAADDLPLSTVREEYRASGQWRADAPAAITGR